MQKMQKMFKPVMLIILALIVILSMLIPVFGQIASANDESSGVSSLSLFDRASEVARTFGTAIAPGTEIGLNIMKGNESGTGGDVIAGNAGGFLGYADYMSDDSGVTGWFSSVYSQSSDMFTYEQMASIIPGTSQDGAFAGKGNPFYLYAGFGEMLTGMGLAGTTRTGSIMGTLGSVATFIVIVAYLVANAAPFLFSIALTLLNVLNPFKLFFTAMDGMESVNLGLLSGVAKFIGDIYQTIQTFSIVALFPLLLVITVIGALVFTRTSALKRFARYGLRLFMLFAGLPIIGATYTGVIEDMNAKVNTGAEYADYLVLSSYVDFEKWASNTRLALPNGGGAVSSSDGMIWKNPRVSGDGVMPVPTRDLVLAINGPLSGHAGATELMNSYGSSGDNVGSVFRDTRGRSETKGASGNFSTTFGLLTRHMSGAGYSGSQYAGEVPGMINKSFDLSFDATNEDDDLGANEIAILKMFTLTGTESRTWSQRVTGENSDWAKAVDWNTANGLFTEGAADDDAFKFGDYTYNIYNNGSLTAPSGGSYSTANVRDMSAEGAEPLAPISTGDGERGGLSPLAMYNFLNTTFTDTGMTIFSPEDTVVDTARDTYASVKFSSTGVTMFSRWVENVVIMVSMATLALAYGGILISAAIKNIPRILSGVFGTALGSIAFTAKLLIATLVMIIQVLGMIVLYYLSEMILMSMIMNMNTFTASLAERFAGAGVLLEFGRALLTTVIVALFTAFMIKNVNIFKEMMEEVISNGINKFMSLLDTSTGGEGLSTAQTTGGRVGNDGKLTDDARMDDAKGIGGVGAMLAKSHDIEAQREQMGQEHGMGHRGMGEMIAARAKTFKDLAGAGAKDAGKSLVAKDPKSYQRELDAKERSVKQAGFGSADDKERYAKEHGFGGAGSASAAAGMKEAIKSMPKDFKDTALSKAKAYQSALSGAADGMDAKGRKLDEHGNVITDENGHAMDADGKPISNQSSVGLTPGPFGAKALNVDPETGAVLDEDGNVYKDENGNGFYQDADGKLVDENGNYMALDSDGTLQPVDSLPLHDGSPVDAASAAMELDNMRSDADAFASMQDAQTASHYGMDNEGNAVDVNGNPLTYTDEDGEEQPVQMSEDGFLTDNLGNKLDISDINGPIDGRGYDLIEDSETGEQYAQHAGDAAMKEHLSQQALSDDPSSMDHESLDSLAQESARANALADQAQQNVDTLKEQGAPAYAIAQAERHAEKAKQQAAKVDGKLANAMQNGTSAKSKQPATKEQADTAKRNAERQAMALKQEQAKLNQLKADGASPQAIARQERKVDAQRTAASSAQKLSKDAAIANKAGRPISDVTDARERTERAEAVLSKALDKQAEGIKTGASDSEMAKRNAAVAQATQLVSKAKDNQARMGQAPQGSREQIDKASAAHEQAKAQHRKASATASRLERKSKPMTESQVRQLKAQQSNAQQTMQATRKDAKRHTAAQTAYKAASNDVAKQQGIVDNLTRRGASPDKIQTATQNLNQAKSKQADARQTMTRNASGAASYKQAVRENQSATQKLNQAGRPMTPEEVSQVKATQSNAQATMRSNQSAHDNYKRQQSVHKQAKRAANASERTLNKLVKQGAPAADIQAAKSKHGQAVQKVKQAESTKQQYASGANAYRDAQATYTQAERRLNDAQPTVSEKDVAAARQAERQALQKVNRASRRKQQLESPKGWSDSKAASMKVPETSNEKGYANLAGKGVNSYADYQSKVSEYQSSIRSSRQRLSQLKSQLKEMKSSNRPVQEVRKIEDQISETASTVRSASESMAGLQDNAHGLLRRMSFDVPGVTRGNVVQSGAVLANQMETMAHVQEIQSNINARRQDGTATADDEKQFKVLSGRLNAMKESLVQSGISNQAFANADSMNAATEQVRQSWSQFIDGKHGTGPANPTAGSRQSSNRTGRSRR